MTKHFVKWASKQKIPIDDLEKALEEVGNGNYEANLGGHIYKKRIRFPGQGKRSSKSYLSSRNLLKFYFRFLKVKLI